MRKTSSANSVASSPPVPARISSTIVRVAGQEQHFQLFFHLRAPLFERSQFFLGELLKRGIRCRFPHQRFGLRQRFPQPFPFAESFDHFLELGVRLRSLLVERGFGNDFRLGELRLERLVALFHRLNFLQELHV